MEAKLLRLECLKLASMVTRDATELLVRAKQFEAHVLNTQEKVQASDGSPKNIGKNPTTQNDILS